MTHNPNQVRFPCSCRDSSHLLVGDFDAEWNYFELSLHTGEHSLMRRLKTAWKILVYGQGYFSDVYLDAETLKDFRKYISELPDLKP